MSFVRGLGLVAALVISTSSIALAQQHQHQGQGHMMGAQSGRMSGMAPLQMFGPASLLEQREKLSLTSGQVAHLTELLEGSKKARETLLEGHDRNHALLMEILTGAKPDPAQARGYFDAAHASMGAAHWAEIEAALEAMTVLTPEQRAMARSSSDSP